MMTLRLQCSTLAITPFRLLKQFYIISFSFFSPFSIPFHASHYTHLIFFHTSHYTHLIFFHTSHYTHLIFFPHLSLYPPYFFSTPFIIPTLFFFHTSHYTHLILFSHLSLYPPYCKTVIHTVGTFFQIKFREVKLNLISHWYPNGPYTVDSPGISIGKIRRHHNTTRRLQVTSTNYKKKKIEYIVKI